MKKLLSILTVILSMMTLAAAPKANLELPTMSVPFETLYGSINETFTEPVPDGRYIVLAEDKIRALIDKQITVSNPQGMLTNSSGDSIPYELAIIYRTVVIKNLKWKYNIEQISSSSIPVQLLSEYFWVILYLPNPFDYEKTNQKVELSTGPITIQEHWAGGQTWTINPKISNPNGYNPDVKPSLTSIGHDIDLTNIHANTPVAHLKVSTTATDKAPTVRISPSDSHGNAHIITEYRFANDSNPNETYPYTISIYDKNRGSYKAQNAAGPVVVKVDSKRGKYYKGDYEISVSANPGTDYSKATAGTYSSYITVTVMSK